MRDWFHRRNNCGIFVSLSRRNSTSGLLANLCVGIYEMGGGMNMAITILLWCAAILGLLATAVIVGLAFIALFGIICYVFDK